MIRENIVHKPLPCFLFEEISAIQFGAQKNHNNAKSGDTHCSHVTLEDMLETIESKNNPQIGVH